MMEFMKKPIWSRIGLPPGVEDVLTTLIIKMDELVDWCILQERRMEAKAMFVTDPADHPIFNQNGSGITIEVKEPFCGDGFNCCSDNGETCGASGAVKSLITRCPCTDKRREKRSKAEECAREILDIIRWCNLPTGCIPLEMLRGVVEKYIKD